MNSTRLLAILLPLLLIAILLLLRRHVSSRKSPEQRMGATQPPLDRGMLYADGGLLKLTLLGASAPAGPPWTNFKRAAEHIRGRDNYLAMEELRRIAEDRSFDSRARLWAWNALREFHQEPDPESADTVQGVVLEVPVNGRIDLLAAYADGSARYLNHSGRVLVWEHRDGPTAALIREQIETAQAAVQSFPPPGGLPPPAGQAIRISLLTFRGIRSRELQAKDLDDPADSAGSVFRSATRVLQAITAPTTTSTGGASAP